MNLVIWISVFGVLVLCLSGIRRVWCIDCGNEPLSTWLAGWYLIIMIIDILYVITILARKYSRDPNKIYLSVLCTGILMWSAIMVWTLLGTCWLISNMVAGNSCLQGIDLIVALSIITLFYLFIITVMVINIYITLLENKEDSLSKEFHRDIEKIYKDSRYANTVNVNNLLVRYGVLIAHEPILKIEKEILLSNFTNKVKEREEAGDCGICLVEFSVGDMKTHTACKHDFHYKCLLGWYKLKPYCPFCRKSFRESLLNAYQETIRKKRYLN